MNEASFDKMKKSKTSSGIKTTLQKSSTNNHSLLNVVISPKIPNKILSPSHEMVLFLFLGDIQIILLKDQRNISRCKPLKFLSRVKSRPILG